MTAPDEPEDAILDLVARCLERIDETEEPPLAILDALCAEHPEHAAALRARLAYLERAGLASGRAPGSGTRTLGRFELQGELGRGGMGVVYLAYDPRLGRRVALKALGPRLVISDRARARFEREIRAVAALHHPRIVPVYEVGEEAGVPYYTMELIEGRTLAQVIAALKELHLRTDELSTSHLNRATFFERTETDSALRHESDSSTLLREAETPRPEPPSLPPEWGKTYVETVCRLVHDVAEALDHAHANGVVHRDVKPSNVLLDGRGRALLFDFGLARMEDDVTLTQSGDFAGTPFYIAPEQISGKRRGVDHRADVYSLGVTLFELLTLQRPFLGRNTQQVFRQILSKDPPLPRKLNRLIPRDLETVCLTALEKDPDRRYQSAGELAADLRRFLEFRPLRARPVGWPTRTARWARRNPGAATAATLAGLIALGVPSAFFASGVVLHREAERTARQAEKASSINRFLLDMLGAAHPAELGFDGTIREAVSLAVERAGTDLGEPEVEAGVRATIGNTYVAVGEYTDAERELRSALALRRAVLDPHDLDVASSLADLGRCRLLQGDLEESAALLSEALDLQRDRGGAAERLRAECLGQLGLVQAERGEFARARELLDQSLAVRRRLFGENAPEVAEGLIERATVLEREARAAGPGGDAALEQAESTYRTALAQLADARGAGHPDTAACRNLLAHLLLKKRDISAAEALFEENVEFFTARLGARHPLVARTRGSRALAAYFGGRLEGARAEAEAALSLQRDILPAGHPELANTSVILALILMDSDMPEDASRLLEEAVAIRRARFGSAAEATAEVLHQLARSYYDQVRLEDALGAGNEALSIYAALPHADRELVGGLEHILGRACIGMGRLDLAREHLLSAARTYAALRGPDAPSTILYEEDLAHLYFLEEDWEDAALVYEQVVAARERTGRMGEHDAVAVLANLAESRARLGRGSEALEAARRALAASGGTTEKMSLQAVASELLIGRVLYDSGRVEEALKPLLEGVGHALQLSANRRNAFDCARLYGAALIDLGRYDEAEYRLQETLAAQAAYLGPQHPDVSATLAELARLFELIDSPEDLAVVRGREELARKLRAAGVPPVFGTADDPPLAYGSYD